ncbi:MAG: DUF4367 domain-containing protein [Clostridia bacterium]|nr:DUF4367 domain-containing protein [Clostridia bacterium]
MSASVPMDNMDILLYAALSSAGSDELDSEQWGDCDKSMSLSRKADRRIWKKLRRVMQYNEKRQTFHPVGEALKRVAMIVLITAAVGFTCLMSVDAVRDAVWTFLIQWYETKISVQITTECDVPLLTEIQEYKEPVVDSDFRRTVIQKDTTTYIVEYENATDLIVYKQRLMDDFNTLLSNENTEMHDVDINQHSGIYTIFETQGVTVTTILWQDGQYVYSVSGNNMELNTMLSIAQSIP